MARNVVELRPRRMPTSPPTSPHTWYEWSVEHDGAEIDVVESWSGSADGPSPSPHDAWLVLRRGPVLRLGAIDGATSPAGSAHYCGLDAASWAAQVTRASLLADDDIPVCLWRANRTLHEPAVQRAGGRAQAGVIGADVRMRWDGDAHAHLARAAGALAFARFGRRWTALFPTAPLTDDAAQVWDAWCATHRGATDRERAAAEDRALGAPGAWHTAAIGRFAEPLLECAEIEGFDELILASANAHLDLASLDALDEWLEGLRGAQNAPPVDTRMQDGATVVRWRRLDARHPSRMTR